MKALKKKFIALFFILSVILGITACGSSEPNTTENGNTESTQNNSETTENNTETESEKKEISVVGEWVCQVGDYYQTYTFNEDGTMTGYYIEPSTYKITQYTDGNILEIFTGETSYWYRIVEENGSMTIGNLIPANTSDKTENSLTFPTVEQITSDSVIEPVEFLYLIQIGLLEQKTVTCNVISSEGNEFTQNFNINETDFLLEDKYISYANGGENVIGTVIFSQGYLRLWEDNMNVTTATCPSTGKECYKLTASVSVDSQPEPITVHVYLEKSTNQLTYVESLNTISNFTYSK